MKNPEIQECLDYGKFKTLDGNRMVMNTRVADLKRSITQKNKLALHPVIVNSDGFVIDGQHRIAAAKDLKIPFYYVVDEESSENDIILLNSHRTNWALKDFVYYYHQKGKGDYCFIKKMVDYSASVGGSFTAVYAAMQNLKCCSFSEDLTRKLRSGDLVITNPEILEGFIYSSFHFCDEINKLLRRFSPKTSPVLFFKSPFVRALCFFFLQMDSDQYQELWRCIKRDYKSFTDSASAVEVCSAMEDCYNYRRSIKFKLVPMGRKRRGSGNEDE